MVTNAPRAKRPITPLAGPYGHPFHPLLVTVPIGTWVASLVFDIASRAADDGGALGEGAYWLIGLGILGAVAAAGVGLLDLLVIPRGTRAFRTGFLHMTLNVTVLLLFVVSFFLRRSDGYQEPTSVGLIVLSAVALGVLAVSGWLGGKMSYRYGVRVADETTQAEGFR